MNIANDLFISAYSDYLQSIIDKSFIDTNEIRIITQSLMPTHVLAIFEQLTATNLVSQCRSYMRVAHGLVQHWDTLNLNSDEKHAVNQLREHLWLDEEDKLTWYRNKTAVDEGVQKLLILLVGLDHTTDKGGLADFFVCKDNKVWHSLGNSYQDWLTKIASDEGLILGEKQIDELNDYLTIIANLVPLTLSQKAMLLEKWLVNYKTDNKYTKDYDGLLISLFTSLTDLGIPYLRIDTNDDIKSFKGAKGRQYLKSAHQFISHRLYNQGNRKTKDLNKIKKYLTDYPETKILDMSDNLITIDDYLIDIENFILNADNTSKDKLIDIDILPVLKALKLKEDKEETTSRASIPVYNCASFEAICKGLNQAINKYGNESLLSSMAEICISVKHFQHDFSNKDAQNNDQQKDVLARSVLHGVLGGIEDYFNDLNDAIADYDLVFLPVNESTTYRSATSNPHVVFEVKIFGETTETFPFKWKLSEFQTERLHVQLAKTLLQKLLDSPKCLLPILYMPKQIYQAIYHASNQEEACRLLGLGLNDIEIADIFANYDFGDNQDIKSVLQQLSDAYRSLLVCVVHEGLYVARKQAHNLLDAYSAAFDLISSSDAYIIKDIQNRFYYAFFMAEHTGHSSLDTVESILLNGYHPAVFELIAAQIDFIIFAVSDTYNKSNYNFHKNGLDDIFVQSEIESPVLALKQKQGISTHTKAFGWLHYIGKPLDENIDLAVQALLQETDEEEDTQEIYAVAPEKTIVYNTLNDYQKVYDHAKDGLRILAINVTNLSSLLTGLTKYCQDSLIKDKNCTHYALHICVYTVGLSKLSAVNTLKQWQGDLTDGFTKKDKILQLKISHFIADAKKIDGELAPNTGLDTQKQTKLGRFDIAFNFNFLSSKTHGKTDPAPAIELQSDDNNLIFPIIYYPKLIIEQQDNLRELRLSQRQINIQSKHANLTANLEVSNRGNEEQYFVVSKMDYGQEDINIIETLHQLSQWVVNIDEYFDYNLLKKGDNDKHKVISFSSGYGHYGELNVTLSTAHHAPQKLKNSVLNHLSGIMHYLGKETLPQLVDEILALNESLSGVANIKAVLGDNEEIRNLYGYALVIKTITPPENSLLSQWIPLDSCQHWFKSQDIANRADLLQLSLTVNEQHKPILMAHIVEAKVGYSELMSKAELQTETSLRHLSQIFVPKSSNHSQGYNQRYWWGQLHRALVLRSCVNQNQAQILTIALEHLSEGDFEIHWTSSIVICHTEDNSVDNTIIHKAYTDEYNTLGSEAKHYRIWQFSEKSFEKILLNQAELIDIPEPIITPPTTIATDKNESTTIDNPQIKVQTNETPKSSVNLTSPSIIPEPLVNQSDQPILPQQTQQPTTLAHLEEEPTTETESIANLDKKIMIGTVGKEQIAVHWEYHHKGLANRHLLIFGASGSGKTYAIQCLLAELATAGISSFIIDYTDGFLTHQSEAVYQQVCQPEEYFVIQKPLPINPFKQYSSEISPDNYVSDRPIDIANRVRGILNSVYQFGEQQVAIIDKVLEEGIDNHPDYSLQQFLEDLESDADNRAVSVATKIRTLVRRHCFDSNSTDNLYESATRQKHPVQVIQLTRIDKDLQRIITEFILWDLWAYVQKNGSKHHPISIVLDEMQNLDHKPNSTIDKLLREGRKFGVSLILATQTISNFDKEQKSRLFQASTKLFFKPATTEVDSFADLLAKVQNGLTKNDWITELNSLKKGQCFFIGSIENNRGQFTEVVKKLDITALEQRGLTHNN
ncbi:ATP-binding protein [Psychrobacter sp. I-STPA10]|uniref:ATP-binding protein n=1 Tax=Psychrobacter sp. I-STPA10 TaxID=2585769 RepID=UPI001E5DD112|nr:helicase HerA-like domain-containing protein [Psychrobacter sp. I-STPA10]